MDISEAFMAEFTAFVEEHKLLHPRDRILVGFSGGPDSTALLQALYRLRPKYQLHLLAAHVNYGLRGADSAADEQFVKDFCFARNINIVIKNAQLAGGNMESRARDIRFSWFNSLREQYHIQRIALGHNREDQAETVLLRLIRGAAASGLKGILPHAGSVIHPLLSFPRARIVEFLEAEGLTWRTDRTNAESRFSRNKIRNDLLPWIQQNMNPDIIDKLYETAAIFAQTDDVMRQIIEQRLQKHSIITGDDECRLPLSSLRSLSPVLRFYLFRALYQHLNGDDKDFYSVHCDSISAVLECTGSKSVHLPNGVVVIKQYDELLFRRAEEPEQEEDSREVTTLRNNLLFGNHRIGMKKIKKLPSRHAFDNRSIAYLDFDKVVFPLILRYRRAGDRFIPSGMGSPKKLQDFFVDEKVPRFDRDGVVIVEDAEKIVWVCGMRVDQRAVVDDNTRSILMIQADRVASARPRSAERKK